MKKILSIALTILMVLSIVPTFSFTASAYSDDTACVIGSTEYKTLFGAEGALQASEDGDTIVFVKNISETLTASEKLDHEVIIDLAGYKLTLGGTVVAMTTTSNLTIRSTVDGKGETDTATKATLIYKANIVKSSAKFTLLNVSGTAAANCTLFEPNSKAATFVCKNSELNSDTGGALISPVNFNYSENVEFENVKITAGGNWNNSAYITFGNGVQGTFKNCVFYTASGGNIAISGNNTNVTFDGCNISEAGSDKWYVVNVIAGTVKFSGGTVIDGKNSQNSVLQISGGNVITDDAIIKGDKGDGSSKKTLVINGGNVEFGKTQILKGGSGNSLAVNDNAALAKAIKAGYAAYSSSEYTARTILSKTSNYQDKKTLYIDVCQHFKSSATCEAAGNCNYCGDPIDALGHQWDEVQYNETQHWYVCTRCEKAGDAENHKGGSATCQEKAVCDVCHQSYGKVADHVFKNYVTGETCEHNTVKVAKCEFGCGTSDYDLSGATKVVEKTPRVEPTCVDKGSTEELICSECQKVVKPAEEIPAKGHTYGAQTIITEPTYFTVGKGRKVCSECGDVYEYDLPKKSFSRNTVAIIAYSETDVAQFSDVFGEEGAIAKAKDNDTVVLIKDIDEDQSCIIADKKVTLDLAGYSITYSGSAAGVTTNADFTIRSTVEGKGEEKTDYASIFYSNAIVNSSATVSVSNIGGVSSSENSLITASDASAKFIVKDCDLNSKPNVKSRPINLKDYGISIDFDNVNFTAYGNWNNEAYLAINNGVKGTFNNCSFVSKNGGSVDIGGVLTNVEFIGCDFSEGGGDKGSVVTVNKGTVKFSGGTVIDGKSAHNSVLVINGGNVTTDDVVIKGDKGDGKSKITLKITGGNVKLGKTTIQKGGKGYGLLCNSLSALKGALAEDYAFFYTSELSGEFAYTYDTDVDLSNVSVLYVGKCEHWSTTATCTEAGNCYYCNKSFDALGHDYSGFDSDENYHWAVCIRCNKKAPDAVNVKHSGGEATCTEKAVCEICNTAYGNPNGHDFSKGEYACDAENHWIKCNNCSIGKKDITPHTVATPADCNNSATCSVCKLIYGDPLGHNYQNYRYNNDATCYKAGTETGSCSRCGKTNTRESDTHPALGHKVVTTPAVPATCVSAGSEGGQHCERCGEITKVPVTIPINPKAHSWDNGVIINKVDCQHEQSALFTCTLCKETKTEIIGNGEHNWVNPVVLKTATCVSGGYTRYTCATCGQTKLEDIPASQDYHSWNSGTVLTPNTCKTDGSIEYTCTLCGAKKVAVLPASQSAHKYTGKYKVKKAATLFATGIKERCCVYCNSYGDTTVIPKLVLKAPKVTIKAGKGSISVKYKKVAKAVGFQVKYKLGKKTVTKTFKTKKAAKKTISKLKSGSYKVQVRAYAQKGKKKAFGKWSKVKTVKVK